MVFHHETACNTILVSVFSSSCPLKFKQAIQEGRMLIISPYNEISTIPTKTFAKRRNLYVMNHSKDFYNILGQYCPNYRMLDKELRNSSMS